MNNPRFVLMNMNNRIADLKVVNNSIVINKLYSDNINSVSSINTWINSRLASANRSGIHNLNKLNNLSTIEKFLSLTRAVSCTDTIWVNDFYNYTTWNDINPYKHKTNRAVVEIAINGESTVGYANIRCASPQYTLDGSVDKCIKSTDDGLYLYKTSGERWSDLAGCRSYCEYYASIIAEQLGLNDFVMYRMDLTKTPDNLIKPYVYCKLFTSEDYGLLQMQYSKYKNYSSDELSAELNTEMRNQYKNMLVFDSLILNLQKASNNKSVQRLDTLELEVLIMLQAIIPEQQRKR